jgi:hypothetical protein
MILFVISVAFGGVAWAVRLPRCEAPPYGGQAAIKAIGSELAWAYHQTMMVNESGDGRFAYCLTRSGMEESGLSFGVSQLDLRTNPKAWPVFAGILQQAGRDHASLVFDDAELSHMKAQLVGKKKAPKARDLLKQDDPRLDPLLVRADEALKSDASRQTIDTIHTEHVKNEVAFVTRTQEDLRSSSVGAGKLLETSLVAKLLIMDYRNLFGDISGTLKPFLMTGAVTMPSGRPVNMSGQTLAVNDIMRFILETKQGSGCKANERAELLRRMGYAIDIARANGDQTHWTQEDRDFFAQALPAILDDACVSRQVDLNHMRALTRDSL